MNNFLKNWELLILMACLFVVIVSLFTFTKREMEKSSMKDKCNSVGMKYQGDYEAAGYKLCYEVNSEGRLIYKEIK